MPEELLIRHCAPTLAALKTGSLFSCFFSCKQELQQALCRLNQTLCKKGVQTICLRFQKKKALLYVYRPTFLSRDLQHDLAARLLRERGYVLYSPLQCVMQLKKRLKDSAEFPHEIGLFLGYPPEDVLGFIDNRAAKCKCSGCWKVYDDAEKAQKLFDRYKKCTAIYCERYAGGDALDRLTVAG